MRVCPECGEPAGERPFCESCGRNLMRVERLPSREEWEARQKYERKRGLDHDDGPRPAASHPRLVRIARLAAVPVAAVVVVVAVALIAGKSASVSGVTASVHVPSPSMVPTLPLGSTVRVLVSQSYVPKVGDIVVFHPPKGADPATPVCGAPNQGGGHAAACDKPTPGESAETFIKRIVAGPGDTITISDGHVMRNGSREQDSSYTEPCGSDPSCNFPTPITIPQNEYFVLGDNRGASDDSRLWGPVPRRYIVGRVLR
jgi:signal peptidase I